MGQIAARSFIVVVACVLLAGIVVLVGNMVLNGVEMLAVLCMVVASLCAVSLTMLVSGAVRDDRRGWHDRVAGITVVRSLKVADPTDDDDSSPTANPFRPAARSRR